MRHGGTGEKGCPGRRDCRPGRGREPRRLLRCRRTVRDGQRPGQRGRRPRERSDGLAAPSSGRPDAARWARPWSRHPGRPADDGGSILVVSETTGWHLAGLVSAVGAASLGAWLIAANRRVGHRSSDSQVSGHGAVLAPGPSRLGRAAGIVMLVVRLARASNRLPVRMPGGGHPAYPAMGGEGSGAAPGHRL
jgi:hypothetical protein